MNKKKTLLTVSIISIIVISIILATIISLSLSKRNQTSKHFTILYDDDDIRVSEEITFYIPNLPQDSKVNWVIGNNSISESEILTIAFPNSTIEILNAYISWSNGIGNASTNISVKNSDEDASISGGILGGIGPGGSAIRNVEIFGYSGISTPNFTAEINIAGFVGSLTIRVYTFFEYRNGGRQFEEEFTRILPSSINFKHTYEGSSLMGPDEGNDFSYYVEFELDNGRLNTWEIIGSIIY